MHVAHPEMLMLLIGFFSYKKITLNNNLKRFIGSINFCPKLQAGALILLLSHRIV